MKAVGKRILIACIASALSTGSINASAQNAAQQPRQPADVLTLAPEVGFVVHPSQDGRVPAPPAQPGAPRMPAPPDTLVFLASEMRADDRVVRGAPYSAQETVESTQQLLDGNRIVRRTTATVYRDSEGRTRREQTLGAVGPFAIAGEPPVTHFINDPVAGVHYILDPRARTARRMFPRSPMPLQATPAPGRPAGPPPPHAPPPGEDTIVFERRVEQPPPGGHAQHREHAPGPTVRPANVSTESLGKQTIEGIEAEGTRHTLTIPAGEIGNEAPIQVVTEHWRSNELQVLVMSRHYDPRFGETIFRLTNISRQEPARALFEVPADYTLIEGPAGQPRQMRRPRQ